MKPRQLLDYVDDKGMSLQEVAKRLKVTSAAIYFWGKQGWIPYDRQCHIQLELPRSGLKASWDDVPASRRKAA